MSPRTPISRRQMLRRSGLGFGSLALAYLLQAEAGGETERASGGSDLRPRTGHVPARAKAVIQLMQTGGPSQMDLFDPKPELQKRHGQKIPLAVDKFLPGNT